ncbi:MAG: DUF6273 domain-containing protein [Candidatus Cloacimonetes bacterium]|nr:DUF6273 domain-containing protein [Candidatus Cloacimonadota bacterium]
MNNDELTKKLLEIQEQMQAAAAKADFVTVMRLSQEIGQLQHQATMQSIQAFVPVKPTTAMQSAPNTQDMVKEFQQLIGGRSKEELVRDGLEIQKKANKSSVRAKHPTEADKNSEGIRLPQTGVTPAVDFAPLSGGLKIIDNKFVEFGSFPQGKNGEVKKILWRVLENKSGEMLLVSEHILACKMWHDTMTKSTISWEVSDLRKWLNGYFYNSAFNSQEKSQIVERLNTKNGVFYHKDNLNKVKTQYAKHNVLYDDTFEKYGEQGGDTKDKVFLLNVGEAIDFFKEKSFIVPQTVWIANKERAATATDYAIQSSTYVQTGITHVALLPFDGETWLKAEGKGNKKIKVAPEFIGCVDYWLRNAGIKLPSGYSTTASVCRMGSLKAGGISGGTSGVRPAILINQ